MILLINIWLAVFFILLTMQTAFKIGFKKISFGLITINSLLNASLLCQLL